jgi:hypothetical protein
MTTGSDPAAMAIPGWGSAMMSATDAVQACTEACTGWQQEIARFADLRLAQNRRSWEALMATRDVAGLMKVQQEWALQAATDYAREATRLARLLTTISLTGTTPAVQEAAKLVA